MSNLVPYVKYSAEEAQGDAEKAAAADAGGSGFFKPKIGKNIIRVLPPLHDTKAKLANG